MAGTIDLSDVCGCCGGCSPCPGIDTLYATIDIPCLYATPLVVAMPVDAASTGTQRVWFGALSPTSDGCGLAAAGKTARGVYFTIGCVDGGGISPYLFFPGLTEGTDFAAGGFIDAPSATLLPTVCGTIDHLYTFTSGPFAGGTIRITT